MKQIDQLRYDLWFRHFRKQGISFSDCIDHIYEMTEQEIAFQWGLGL